MKIIGKNSGASIVFNIDPPGQEALRQSQDWFENNGMKISQGLIVRRAVRVYHARLLTLTTPEALEAERIEVMRARKGVL